MKDYLRNFPNGARIVYHSKEWKKCASKVKDHFCLIEADPNDEKHPVCLYLHRDTFVEPVQSTFQF